MDVKEERLLLIVKKLDNKLKSVLIENNELKQRLELAVLDQQLAEEQAKSATTELESLRLRNMELEELHELSTELEASLAGERAELVQKLANLQSGLEKAQEAKHISTQTYDSLRFELNKCNAQLGAAKLSLDIIKRGASTALAPIVGEEQSWMPLVDLLAVHVEPMIDEFNSGKTSSTALTKKLRAAVNESIDTMLEFPSRFSLPEISRRLNRLEPSPEVDRVRGNLDMIKDMETKAQSLETQDSVRSCSNEILALSQNLEETIMRNNILETKLKQALSITEEVEFLRTWQASALEREKQLKLQIDELRTQTSRLQIELASQKRQNLPYELTKLTVSDTYYRLNQTVAFLSRSTSAKVTLLGLDTQPLQKISRLAGNPRTKRLRQAARKMSRGKTSDECQKLGLQQEIELMLV